MRTSIQSHIHVGAASISAPSAIHERQSPLSHSSGVARRTNTMGASSTKLEPLKPVDNVPVRQLFGTWFVIAVMPTIFEKGAHNAIETYSDGGKTEGAVTDIDFRYNNTQAKQERAGRPLKKLPQTGSSWYDDKTAGWKVSPFWPVKMPYLVIDKSKTALDNDAAWFVVRTSA